MEDNVAPAPAGDPRLAAIPDSHGHAKGEHKPFVEERPIPYTARMLFLWFYHACRRGMPRFMMVADHMNYLTFEDPAAVNLVRRALKLAQAGDLYGAAETAGVDLHHAAVVSEAMRTKGMRYSIGAEVDNDPRSRPDAQNIVDAMRPDGMVRSVHFLSITHPVHGENWTWAFDNPEFRDLYDVVGTEKTWELYMATLLDAIDKLPGNIVGHFYVPAVFGHWPEDVVLEAYEDQLVNACAERGMAIEFNSRYFYRHFAHDEANLAKYRTAMVRLMRKAAAKDVGISVGSDAHSPKDQAGGFEAVLELLDEAEINEVAFPVNGRLARVALRATEEVLRQAGMLPPEPPPAPEPPPPPPPVEEPVVAAAPKRKSSPKTKNVAEAVMDSVASVATAAAEAVGRVVRGKKPKAAAETAGETPAETVEADAVAAAPAPPPKKAKSPKPKPVAAEAAAVPAAEPAETHAPVPTPVVADSPKPEKAKAPSKKAPAEKPAPKAAAPAKKAAVPAPAPAKPAPKPAAKAAVKATPAKASPKKTAAPAKKAAPVKKTAAKKAMPAKKAAAKKAPAKKAAPVKKAAAKKVVPVKKAAAKKAVAKKSAPKKPVAKKAAKKSAPVKKTAPAKKSAAKKATAKKSAGRKR